VGLEERGGRRPSRVLGVCPPRFWGFFGRPLLEENCGAIFSCLPRRQQLVHDLNIPCPPGAFCGHHPAIHSSGFPFSTGHCYAHVAVDLTKPHGDRDTFFGCSLKFTAGHCCAHAVVAHRNAGQSDLTTHSGHKPGYGSSFWSSQGARGFQGFNFYIVRNLSVDYNTAHLQSILFPLRPAKGSIFGLVVQGFLRF